jgi:hypothetical protein
MSVLVPPDVLGHLMHRVQLQCPEELGVMMSEVSLNRLEQLLLGLSCELRPALAVGDPAMSVRDPGHLALVDSV